MNKTYGAVLVAGFATAMVAFAAKVTTDYDKSVDFGRYHTYSWVGVRANDTLWQDRIQQDVDRALTAKGWQRTDSSGDAAVAAMGTTKNQQSYNTFYDGFGGGWRWWGFGGDGLATTQVINTRVGELDVDIFDAGTKRLIWRGRGDEALSSKPEKNEKKLEETVDDMFKKFPPQGKG